MYVMVENGGAFRLKSAKRRPAKEVTRTLCNSVNVTLILIVTVFHH